ncbi:ABC transporter permease [Macrococcus hajekii]|uniref:ABC transporter permease n=1 Tax=Macrococcus hajekii TaxID=198482 RepID=A0A4R6BNK0_9STAP|nr:oligopeptide ABC transporter permease [Macrococcus hajekii]TDM03440.1 ABC transporter permease [Macrococcus hajekii]GGA98913.1 peptide ABC transporter permease [Macrococcus hajekii]
MLKFILKRLGYMIITILIVTTATFFLMKLMPGSPYNDEKLSAEQKAIVNEKYGLNDPMGVQYVNYMKNVAKGDFGNSFQYDNRPVTGLILPRLGPSAEIGTYALIFGTIVGIILGVIAAVRQNTWIDYLATIFSVLAISVPSFVLAALLQYYLTVEWQLLPTAGWENITYAILPALALSAGVIATIARYIRSEMIEVLSSDYITLAKAKGNSTSKVLFGHALRNALIPIITLIGPMAVGILTGALTIETIFAIPGLGEQFVRSIQQNDYPVIMALTIMISFLFILVLFIVDILYGIIDPRIRVQGGKS